VDAEPDGQPTALADGDDLNPPGAPDDEDGVTLPPILTPGTFAYVGLLRGLSPGRIDAWIDFNGNGVFDHPAEHLWGGTSRILAPVNNFVFSVPAAAVPGPTYARFRISNNGGLPPTGFAPDGEVEDYRVEIEGPPTGTITAHKFNDLNGNGLQEPGESWLNGWRMDIYNGFGCSAPAVSNGITIGTGNVIFVNLPAGDYSIREMMQSGWQNTTDLCQNVTLAAGGSETVNFGNQEQPQTGDITAHKFNDLDGDGILDAGEPALGGWTMTLYNNPDCDLNGRGQVKEVGVTDVSGNYLFTNLDAGNYSVAETLLAGWQNTTDLCQNVTLVAGVSEAINFGNRELPPPGTITAHKFYDQNGNGVLDVGEPGLSGWTMTLYSGPGCDAFNGRDLAEGVTDGDGNTVFTDLPTGTYSVAETLQAGWLNTTNLCQDVTMAAGGSEIVNVGNQPDGDVSIWKEQSAGATVVPGETFFYDLTIENAYDGMVDMLVTDLLDDHLDYVDDTLEIRKDGVLVGGVDDDLVMAGDSLEYRTDMSGVDWLNIRFEVWVDEFANAGTLILNEALVEVFYRGSDIRIDDALSNEVRTEVVPEPSTIFLFGTGLLGVIVFLRKRKRRR
jgi:hypothetical protein